jgi:5-methylcytosine-specific restriction endonuclease McrA
MDWNMSKLLNMTGTTPVRERHIEMVALAEIVTMKNGEEIPVSFRVLSTGKGAITINGVKCVVYIKNDTSGKQKWHFHKCSALKTHQTFEKRYVTKSDNNGLFLLENGKAIAIEPCSKCLSQSGKEREWYSLQGTLEQRNSMFIPMVSNQEFFETLDSCYSHARDLLGHEYQGYVREWKGISFAYRKSKNWTCEDCNLNLKNHKHLLHTHHVNMDKKNNDYSNFRALCVDCHSKQPFHYERMSIKFAKEIEFIGVLKKNKKK